MYRAVVFDLDGTLVQTEKLKATSYARAAVELCPTNLAEEEVVEAFKEVVGRSRREVSLSLMEKFGLEGTARTRMDEFGVRAPWQAYARLRVRIYERMLADPNVLRRHRWPHNLELLQQARERRYRTGLATMSHCEQAKRVLEILELESAFDFVATRDDVEHPKPDPEIYLLVAHELSLPPRECLVVEDSPAGVEAAKAAGMSVIAVTTPFTRQAFQERQVLDRRWVVDEPERLPAAVRDCLEAHQRGSHGG
ncbi:MAG: HAD family hydrolase [Acidobacteriota bacterium]